MPCTCYEILIVCVDVWKRKKVLVRSSAAKKMHAPLMFWQPHLMCRFIGLSVKAWPMSACGKSRPRWKQPMTKFRREISVKRTPIALLRKSIWLDCQTWRNWKRVFGAPSIRAFPLFVCLFWDGRSNNWMKKCKLIKLNLLRNSVPCRRWRAV